MKQEVYISCKKLVNFEKYQKKKKEKILRKKNIKRNTPTYGTEWLIVFNPY